LALAAGVENHHNPHSWRHAFGRDTTLAGLPTATLQGLMGHSSIVVTEIYARFKTNDLQAAHARFTPLLGDLERLAINTSAA
jgi:site-specific recombinase XerD